MESSKSKPCKVCGCTQTKLIDGYYYCIECGTQDTEIQETILDREREINAGEYAFGKKTKIREEKFEVEMSEEWKIWHAFNFIVANMADELITLGASMSFKIKLLWVWTKYIRKFHQKGKIGQVNARKNKVVDSDSEVGSDESEIDNDDEEFNTKEDGKNDYELNLKHTKHFSMHLVYALLFVSLNLDQSEIQLSDIMRWKREGRLSFGDAIKYVPEELDVWAIPAWRRFVAGSKRGGLKSSVKVLLQARSLFHVLGLGTPYMPNLSALMHRYCKELCLPKEFRALVMSLLDQCINNTNGLLAPTIVPNFETIIMACIVVGLKMCFGLDDDYDLKLSFYVDEINDEHHHLNAYRIGASEPTDRLFNFRDWLRFLEYRKQILAKYYFPMAYLHQIGLKEPLGSEALKDHRTLRHSALRPWRTKKALEKIQIQLLKNLPLKENFKVIPKEEFAASLTPLTSYTVFLVQRITDAEERLILTEDFSKYSLKYACKDLCLKSSEIEDNLIQGVSEEKKNILLAVEDVDKNIYKGAPDIFVIDYEYDDWAADYRNAEKEEKNSEEKNIEDDKTAIPNVMEELDETENIFSCSDPNSVASFNNTIAQNTFDNNSMGEYGTNFQDFNIANLTAFDHFDPLYFNREELIRKLVTDACQKYKCRVPFEYREAGHVINRKPRTTDEARVRRVNQYQISSLDILKTYKSLTTEKEPTPEVNREELDDMVPEQNNTIFDPVDTDNGVEHLNVTDDAQAVMDTSIALPMEVESVETPSDVVTEIVDDTNKDTLSDIVTEIVDDTVKDTSAVKDVDTVKADDDLIDKVVKKDTNYLKRIWGNIKPQDIEELLIKKAKLTETRAYFEPLIKDVNLDKFKYYLKHYTEINSEQKLEETLLTEMPNSLRVVLQNCASIIEYPMHKLFIKMQQIENCLFLQQAKELKIKNLLMRSVEKYPQDIVDEEMAYSEASQSNQVNSEGNSSQVANTEED